MRGFHSTGALVVLLASTALSAPALADNPKYRNWDENGVDLVHGDYRFNFVEGSIGSGKSELAMVRVNNSDAFSQWDQLGLNRTFDGLNTLTRVTMTDGSDEVFVGNASTEANGTSIYSVGTSIFYVAADGTEIEFYNPVAGSGTEYCFGTNFPCNLLPKQIKFASGRIITFAWTVVGSGTNHAARIGSITNSDGYSIVFSYESNTPGVVG